MTRCRLAALSVCKIGGVTIVVPVGVKTAMRKGVVASMGGIQRSQVEDQNLM